MNTGIVYGNIVIQFRYFFVFGVFAKQLKAGLAKTLSPALGGDNNIPDLSCTTRLLLFLVRYDKQDWQWRTPFRTETISFDDLTAKEAIFMQLDESLQNIRKFEKDLMEKLQ